MILLSMHGIFKQFYSDFSGGGIGVLVMILFLFIFIGYRRRKSASSNFLSTNSDPSSKSDLEGGGVYFGVPLFSYTELEEATSNFDSKNELGDGGFGTVYYGKS